MRLLLRLPLVLAVVSGLTALAIALSRTDMPEERSGNQEPAAVQRIDTPPGLRR